VTRKHLAVNIPARELGLEFANGIDLLAEEAWIAEGPSLRLSLGPYDVLWLKTGVEKSWEHYSGTRRAELGRDYQQCPSIK
jgi:hypothetical protein